MNDESPQRLVDSSFILQRSTLKLERMCFMKFVITTLGIGLVLSLATAARAQEPELVNESVARVNNDIITRADYLNALRDFKEELARQMQQSGKSEADVNAEYERMKSTVLDYLIDDLLLEQ